MMPVRRTMATVAASIAILVATGAAGVWILRASDTSKSTASGGGHNHGGGGEEGDHKDGTATLTNAQVTAAGIELLKAEPGVLQQTIRINGIVQPNQEAVVLVTPRFPGIVRDVRKRLGDTVKPGEILVSVESNQSMTVYDLKAPIAGTIIERNASLGEYVSEQKPVFVIADLSTVWVDFSIYRRDFGRVRIGDTILIDTEDTSAPLEARIAYVSPISATETQTGVARAVVANDSRLRPGLFTTARLILGSKKVDLAIRLTALQTIDGKTVVFVRSGNQFETREVEIGARDGEFVEVIFGLLPGDVYAGKNSFVIKAELAKKSAAHEH